MVAGIASACASRPAGDDAGGTKDSDDSGGCEAPTAWYADADGDGYGDPGLAPTQACAPPSGTAANAGDCDDALATVFPGSHAREVPGDQVDQDCDGQDVCRDLDCDGWPDIVFANHDDDSSTDTESYVYFGSGNGYLPDRRAELPASGAIAAAAADFDGDGHIDVVLANFRNDDDLYVDSLLYWGGPDGLLAEEPTGLDTTGAFDVCVGDLEGDGDPDIVFPSQTTDAWQISTESMVFLNGVQQGGRAEGWNRIVLPTWGAVACALGDLQGDGFLEIAFANHASPDDGFEVDSYVYLGTQQGWSEDARVEVPTLGANGVAMGDVNGDGYLDLAFANYATNAAWGDTPSYLYYGGLSGWSEQAREELGPGVAYAVVIADVDSDGWNDLVLPVSYNPDGGYAAHALVYSGGNDGLDVANPVQIAADNAIDALVADLDGDGWNELVFASYTDPEQNYEGASPVYWGSSEGFSEEDRDDLETIGPEGVAAGDLDGDGIMEVVFGSSASVGGAEASVYWGGSDGYATDRSTALPVMHSRRRPVIVGAFPP